MLVLVILLAVSASAQTFRWRQEYTSPTCGISSAFYFYAAPHGGCVDAPCSCSNVSGVISCLTVVCINLDFSTSTPVIPRGMVGFKGYNNIGCSTPTFAYAAVPGCHNYLAVSVFASCSSANALQFTRSRGSNCTGSSILSCSVSSSNQCTLSPFSTCGLYTQNNCADFRPIITTTPSFSSILYPSGLLILVAVLSVVI